MPVATAGLTDIGAGDPQPLVLRRGGKHPPEQLAVAGLELGALPQLMLRHADPCRQRIADRLQVAETQRARLAGDRRDRRVDLQAWKGIGKE